MSSLPLVFLFQNCGSTVQNSPPESSLSFPNSSPNLYFKTSEKIIVEVFYEPGAEPYQGTTAAGRLYWSLLEENLNSIFQYRSVKPLVIVPKSLSEMTILPQQNHSQWLGTEIVSLDSRTRQTAPSSQEARFYIYFLNGYYDNGAGPQNGVIGVSLNGTPIIAMFKQVIKSTGGLGPVPKFVEQSTLIHEMGHALGFVNNGVPMKNPHQDVSNGAHTINKDCVMHWLNEGLTDLSKFVQKYVSSGTSVMWGPEVLDDARAFSQ